MKEKIINCVLTSEAKINILENFIYPQIYINNNYIMKTNNRKIATVLATWLFALLMISWVSAYQGDPSVQWPDYSAERHEAMTEAFETNNYEAWKVLMEGKGRVTDVVTADNFDTFVEANSLAKAGDLEWSKALRAELGLGLKDGSNQGNGKWLNKWAK